MKYHAFFLSVLVSQSLYAGSASASPDASPDLPVATWGAAEVHGGTLTQRTLARTAAAHLIGRSFVMDTEAFRQLCDTIRERTSRPGARCSLVFSNSRQAHYLVEIPDTTDSIPQAASETYNDTDAVLPDFLVKLYTRLFAAYQANLGSVREDRYAIHDGQVYFAIPALDAISAEMARSVPANTEALLHVLAHARDPEQRAHAAFFLGWSAHPANTLERSLAAFQDPDETVRNNYSLMAAIYAPAAPLPLQRQLAALWCRAIATPIFTDRSKALLGLSRIAPELRRNLPAQCAETAALIGQETALANIRNLATVVSTSRRSANLPVSEKN